MDAHVFRRVARLLSSSLHRARLERVHAPIPSVTAFSLFAAGKKICLMMRAHRSRPLLFLTGKSPLPNPAFPPASIMRLRKYAEGRILGEAHIDWPGRRMAFALPGPGNAASCWLLLDLKHGPAIVDKLPEAFATPPEWPDAADLPALLEGDETASDAPWKRFQVLTPLLRQTLRRLDSLEAAALLVDLEDGQGDLFWYGERDTPDVLSAWPLAPETGSREKNTPVTPEAVFPLLEAMHLPLLLAEAKTLGETPALKQEKAASKKQKRLLANLKTEKERLDAMFRQGTDARVLQRHLWEYPPDARMEEICLPRDPDNPEHGLQTIPLNSMMSLTENMQAMFKKAAKAQRGLAMLEKRMALADEIRPAAPFATGDCNTNVRGKRERASSRIQEFLSSDGFVLLRGRNAEGNRDLLRIARPFDLWFHVEDGPSAHLVLRRNHAAQAVPESTLREAAALVGLRSWRKNDPKAPVMAALAKHVQPIKGAKAGTVRVNEVERTILADLDPSLEERLARKT